MIITIKPDAPAPAVRVNLTKSMMINIETDASAPAVGLTRG